MTTPARRSLRLALYARVSTADQRPQAQLDRLREYALSRTAQEALEYVDQAQSGRKESRPALDDLLAAARRREMDAVAVVKLDRLARSVRHLTRLAGELEALGVDLIVLDQGLDTTTPAGRLLFHMIGAIAEFEADLIRERTLDGLAAARRRGAKLGRPPVTDRRTRERIARLRRNGRSIRDIAATVGVSVGTVHAVVKSP